MNGTRILNRILQLRKQTHEMILNKMVQPHNWNTSGMREDLTINEKRLWKGVKDWRLFAH
jgi:very-short-patch-repair endonuclease